jgi:hypothetical protein
LLGKTLDLYCATFILRKTAAILLNISTAVRKQRIAAGAGHIRSERAWPLFRLVSIEICPTTMMTKRDHEVVGIDLRFCHGLYLRRNADTNPSGRVAKESNSRLYKKSELTGFAHRFRTLT